MPVSAVPDGAMTTPLMVTAVPEMVAGKSESEDAPFVVWQAAALGPLDVEGLGALDAAGLGPLDVEGVGPREVVGVGLLPVEELDPLGAKGTDTVSVARRCDPFENLAVTTTVYRPALT